MVDQSTLETVTGSVAATGDTLSGSFAGESGPTLLAGAQYVRSISFQIVDAPLIHARPPVRPNTTLTIDVNARQITDNQPDFEVDLGLRCIGMGEAPAEGTPAPTLFEANITYSGLFSVRNVTAETFEPLLLVDAPRLLFPAARNYLADLTREAGFIPVLLQPIDFVALWQSRRRQQAAG